MKQGWGIKKIKDICDKASSNIAQNKITELDGDYPVFGASGFVQNVDFYHQGTEYIGIVKDGSGVGRVNKYPAYSSLLGTLQYILPKEGYDLNYVAYALKSLNLAEFASGAAIPHIYFKDYGEEAIPVPPREEQERIVAELDCLSGVIEKKREQLKELDALAQSIFYQMFGDPITNEKGWEVKKLGEVCDIINGFAFKSNLFRKGGDAILRISNIQNGYVDLTDAAYFDKSDYEKVNFEKYAVKPYDIVIALSGATTGKLGINTTGKDLYLNQRVAICREKNNDITRLFLLYYLHDQSLKFLEDAAGVAQPNLSTEQMKEYAIGIPPLTLQQEFADKIEAIEKQKELIKESIKETETLFNARMDYYFN